MKQAKRAISELREQLAGEEERTQRVGGQLERDIEMRLSARES